VADLKRWFKVWTSVLVDMDNLSAEAIGHWVRLGARIALVGTRGSVKFDGWSHAAAFFRVPQDDVTLLLQSLPGVVVSDRPIRWPHGARKDPVCDGVAWVQGAGLTGTSSRGGRGYEEWCTHHGPLYVTMMNWHKYQEDTTQASRGRRHAVRGEEKRREEKRQEEKRIEAGAASPPPPPAPGPEFKVNQEIQAALKQAPRLGAVPRLWSVEFWRAEVRANGDLDLPLQILKAEAWMVANPTRAPKKNLARFLHNWLTRTTRDEEPE
jgi:hypothetical protein